jgi:hypothetical protein
MEDTGATEETPETPVLRITDEGAELLTPVDRIAEEAAVEPEATEVEL